MNADILNKKLQEVIKSQLPEGANMANTLMDILNIGREAVYRRLRGDVPFSFYEAALIARKLGLSMNEIVEVKTNINEYLFHLRPQRFYNVDKSHYPPLQAFIDSLKDIAKEPKSEFVSSSNLYPSFPGHLFPEMFKLSAFKSMYEDLGISGTKPYKEMILPKEYVEINKNIILGTMNIKETSYIWKSDLLKEPINEIKYFESIGLLDNEDIMLIKKDIVNFIDFIEDTAIRGSYRLTGNKVNIYISNINFDASYYFLESSNYTLSMIGAFSFNHITSLDADTLEIMKKKILSLKRISTLISESSEKQRLIFFRKLRESIEVL